MLQMKTEEILGVLDDVKVSQDEAEEARNQFREEASEDSLRLMAAQREQGEKIADISEEHEDIRELIQNPHAGFRTPSSDGSCHHGWVTYVHEFPTCYLGSTFHDTGLGTARATFDTAVILCERKRAWLAYPRSEEELKVLSEVQQHSRMTSGYCFVGIEGTSSMWREVRTGTNVTDIVHDLYFHESVPIPRTENSMVMNVANPGGKLQVRAKVSSNYFICARSLQ